MFSLLLILVVLLLASVFLLQSQAPKPIKQLVLIGIAFRLVGAATRYNVIYYFYDGHADAIRYYEMGVLYARKFTHMDFSPLTNDHMWRGGNWWGTEFVRFVSGFIVSIIGPSIQAEFVVFALFGFVGLLGFAAAFYRTYSKKASYRYLCWLCIFPSLWFWPSSIGKEALILLGLGLAVMAFVGRRGRINWLLLIGGLLIVFSVRPQVAAILLASLVLAQWLGLRGSWTTGRILQGIFLLVVGVAGIVHSMRSVGIEQFDTEGIQSYAMDDPARRTTGGTSVETVSLNLKGVPMAVVNVLFRPFIWEATNVMVLLSALEILLLWLIICLKRRQLVVLLKRWRDDRLLCLSLAFIVLYSIPLGMMLVNVGIIARMRTFLFPFLFLLFEAGEEGVPRKSRKRMVSTIYRRSPGGVSGAKADSPGRHDLV